jgi:Ni,Fe-hydrogenase III component G
MDTWQPAHLSTITGNDRRDPIDVIYHFVVEGVSLNVRASVPKAVDQIDSITRIVPAAILYEREVAEMFGITMVGHPDPRRLVLPEDWPEGDYPLRRDDSGDEEDGQDNG